MRQIQYQWSNGFLVIHVFYIIHNGKQYELTVNVLGMPSIPLYIKGLSPKIS